MWPNGISGLGNIVWDWIEGSAHAEKPTAPKNESRGEPSFSAPVFNLSSLFISHAYAAPLPSPARDEQHWNILQANWQRNEKLRRQAAADSLTLIDQSLGLVDPQSTSQAGPTQKIKRGLMSESRHINFQAENWLMLEAARKCVDMFFIYTRGEDAYLDKAETYITRGLNNPDTNNSFDIYRWPPREFFSSTIHPIEAYFELRLERFRLLSITEPKVAIDLSKDIEAELKSLRIVQAQRSNYMSSQGYINRLNIFRGFAGIYNPEMAPTDALNYAQLAEKWARQQHQKSATILKRWGMNKKDLFYDILYSQVVSGRLQLKLNQYDNASRAFQAVLNTPEASRKFGGFLDMGLAAFYGLVQTSLASSRTRDKAAEKFSAAIDWQKLNNNPDLKEALGLLIREESLSAKLADLLQAPVGTLSDFLGNWALYLNRPWLAPNDGSDIISQINLDNYQTPADRLALAVKLIDYIELPFDQKAEIVRLYGILP